MDVLEDEDFEVDACRRCGGVFYDADELHALTGVDLGGLITDAVAEPLGLSSLQCPAHDERAPQMLAFRLTEGGAAEIDRCGECHGVWLDHGERESLEAMRGALERARLEIHGAAELDAEEEARIRRLLRAGDLTAMMLRRGVARRPWVTWGVMLVALLLLIPWLGHHGRGVPELVGALAFVPAHFLDRPWAWVTHSLVHVGWLHLLLNGIYILALGVPLELYLGRVRFALLWALGALGGAIGDTLADPGCILPAVGSSSSVSAIMGAFVITLPRTKAGPARERLQYEAAVFFVLFVVQQLILAVASVSVSWGGHLGGLVAGIAFAFSVGKRGASA